jgi:uncharacterized protein YqjF (DUF2071 family)
MAGNRPEERVRLPSVTQAWRQVTFLHWQVDPDDLARLLPSGLEPDLIDGAAWVGMTPFRVERMRVLGAVPTLSPSFPETNLRTYVRDRRGRDGLWFLSIDVTSIGSMVGGRSIGVPYHLASMSVEGDAVIRYHCRREAGLGHDITVSPGRALTDEEVTPLVSSLVGRWRAFTCAAGRLASVPVEHEPWPLRHAELTSLDESLVSAAGLPEPTAAPMVHFSDGVDARLGPPRPARS